MKKIQFMIQSCIVRTNDYGYAACVFTKDSLSNKL